MGDTGDWLDLFGPKAVDVSLPVTNAPGDEVGSAVSLVDI